MKAALRLLLVAVVLGIAWKVRGGFGDIGGALDRAGWQGVMLITVLHLVPLTLCGISWGLLLPGASPSLFILARWVRDGVGELAGFLPMSGEVAAVRLLTLKGLRPGLGAALTVVDLTAEALSQFVFSLVGVGLWMALHPHTDAARWGMTGLAVSIPVVLALLAVQHSSVLGFLSGLPARLMPSVWQSNGEGGLMATVSDIYGDRRRVFRSVLVHLAAWVAGCIEAWVALRLLGHPLSVPDVLALESLIFAIRSAAFVVPAGIGLQEGGYVLIGAALGLPAEVALAVSLLKRGRELILGLPTLVVWHWMEGRKDKAA
jgi:putative membrane protein